MKLALFVNTKRKVAILYYPTDMTKLLVFRKLYKPVPRGKANMNCVYLQSRRNDDTSQLFSSGEHENSDAVAKHIFNAIPDSEFLFNSVYQYLLDNGVMNADTAISIDALKLGLINENIITETIR